LPLSDNPYGECTDYFISMTGILDAATVRDADLVAQLRPDDGGPAIQLAFQQVDAASVLAAMCEVVTICGTLRRPPDCEPWLELDHIGVCADTLDGVCVAESRGRPVPLKPL
jgi:hypothetical protein